MIEQVLGVLVPRSHKTECLLQCLASSLDYFAGLRQGDRLNLDGISAFNLLSLFGYKSLHIVQVLANLLLGVVVVEGAEHGLKLAKIDGDIFLLRVVVIGVGIIHRVGLPLRQRSLTASFHL